MRRAGNAIGTPPELVEPCSMRARTGRAATAAAMGGGFGLLLAHTIIPLHPLLGLLGGALAGTAYAGAADVGRCDLGGAEAPDGFDDVEGVDL